MPRPPRQPPATEPAAPEVHVDPIDQMALGAIKTALGQTGLIMFLQARIIECVFASAEVPATMGQAAKIAAYNQRLIQELEEAGYST